LEQRCFDLDRLSRRSLRRFLRHERAPLLVAEGPGLGLAGYALVTLRRGARAARLYSLAVDPAQRRQGLGGRLLLAAEAAARRAGALELRLEVRADNGSAIAAYEAAGYLPFGRYLAYYEDGADALRFAKPLPAPARRKV
jgi:ribosomal protein S18 acetylase RimI-like enzyme